MTMTTETAPVLRPSAWRYAIAVALLLGALCAGWVWGFFASPAPVREAQPVAEPGDVITLQMKAGVTYLVFHEAVPGEVGAYCEFSPENNEAVGLGLGGVSRSDIAYRAVPARVTFERHTYEYAMTMTNANDRRVDVQCKNGPLLAEVLPGYTRSTFVAAAVAGLVVLASVASVAWSRRRRTTDTA